MDASSSYNFLSSTDSSAHALPTPHIAEDTLVYSLHLPPLDTSVSASPASLASLDASACAALIDEEVLRLLHAGLREGQGEWIWHKDPWELRVATPEEEGAGPSPRKGKGKDRAPTGIQDARELEGRMRVGDCVDDEWLVVWLLREVSRKWPEVIISVRDTDGDFLLIEAANALPKWVTPGNSENRLWMLAGHLHLIPLTIQSPASSRPQGGINAYEDSAPSSAYLSPGDALTALRSPDAHAFRAPEIERDVYARIERYPAAMGTHCQRVVAYLPREVARALRARPSLVQRAVEGFYVRDPAQLRTASRASRFSPASGNTVLSTLFLTRTAYAQLRGQVFHPPKVFGAEWRVAPAPADAATEARQRIERETKRRDLGVKLTTGFQIMYTEDARRSRARAAPDTEEGRAERWRGDEAYERYIRNLGRAGWFGGEMEGSKGYQEREARAVDGWERLQESSPDQRVSFAQEVENALGSEGVTADAPADNLVEDSDDWLDVSPDELDGMLQAASGGMPTPQAGDAQLGDEHAKVLSDLAERVNGFVEGKGDLDGARFEDELSDEDMLGDSDDETDPEEDEEDKEERSRRMDALVPALPAEEWGRKTQAAPKQDLSISAKASAPAPGSKRVSFDASAKADTSAAPKPGRIEPLSAAISEYDGMNIDSEDESEEDEDTAPTGWGAQSSESIIGEGEQTKTELAASIKALADEFSRDVQQNEGRAAKSSSVLDKKTRFEEVREERPAVQQDENMEPEPDMAAEEEDFLRFAREALGINEDQWNGMLDERKSRGAYVPAARSAAAMPRDQDAPMSFADHRKANATAAVPSASAADKGKAKEAPPPLQPGQPDPKLDTFDKVMDAMDRELAARASAASSSPAAPPKPVFRKPASKGKQSAKTKASSKGKPTGSLPPLRKPLPTEADLDDMDEDDLIAMDRELRAALKGAGVDVDSDGDSDDGLADAEMRDALAGAGEEGKAEYRMMKDFLESYRSQNGQSGVVGNLFGRLGEQAGR